MTAAILAMGAATPIGLSAATASAAYFADLPNHREHPFFVDKRGAPVSMAYVDGIDALPEAERIALLAQAALADLLRDLPGDVATPADLLLALPSARPGIDEAALGQTVVEALRSFAPALSIVGVKVGHFDQAGGVMALGAARMRAAQAGARPSLVIAADSLVGPDALDWIDAGDRLLSPANAFGLIPGEAAGALLIGPPGSVAGLPGVAAVVGYGEGRETHDKPPGPWLGRGLSRAVLTATEGMPEAEVRPGHIFADLNGEPWRADSFGHALTRFAPRLADGSALHVLANRTGDIGAAFGIVAAIFAVIGRAKGFLPGRHAGICAMAGPGARAAVVLDLGPEGRLWE